MPPANHVAVWDGDNWTALGSGIDSDLYALAADGNGAADGGGNLFAGGSFALAGNKPSSRIAHWYEAPPAPGYHVYLPLVVRGG